MEKQQKINCAAVLILMALLAGCSHRPMAPPDAGRLNDNDSLMVLTRLSGQLDQWRGTPYHYGGMSKRGVDCSGFVMLTFRDQFSKLLPRETSQQAQAGQPVAENDLRPGDLVFFKIAGGENGLHVGIYQGDNLFIHASTSQGVTRSSLKNPYWQKHFWQARRL